MTTNKPGSILSVLAVALLVGMAMPASADHDDKAGKVHKDPEGKITYVNAALIGDHTILCPGGLAVTLFPSGANSVHVIVYDPTNENAPPLVDEIVPLPGGPYGPIPIVDVPGQRICLGGAASSTSDTNPLPIPAYWEVWLEDIVYRLIRDLTNGAIDIVPAGFARMEATAVRSVTVKKPDTCVPAAPVTRICQTNTVTEIQTKVLTQFSVCGKAGVNGIDTDAFNDLIAAKGAYDTYTISKEVYVDGVLFFQFDCGLGGTNVGSVYDELVRWYNNDPANPPTGPLAPPFPSNDVSTCNSPLGSPPGGILCLAPFPAGASFCWNTKYAAGHTAAGPGIIGTVGWSHVDTGNLNCHEPLGESPWLKVIVVESGFVIQHFPVDIHIDP